MHIQSPFSQLMSLPSFVLYLPYSLLDCFRSRSSRPVVLAPQSVVAPFFVFVGFARPVVSHGYHAACIPSSRLRFRIPACIPPLPANRTGRTPAVILGYLIRSRLYPMYLYFSYSVFHLSTRRSAVDHAHPVDEPDTPFTRTLHTPGPHFL